MSRVVLRFLEKLVGRHRRANIGRRIVDGYRRIPQTDDEARWSDAATIAMIHAEPWSTDR